LIIYSTILQNLLFISLISFLETYLFNEYKSKYVFLYIRWSFFTCYFFILW